MYKTEGNINFYDLLNNKPQNDNTSKDNICLITREPLDNTKTTLECGHSFNYKNIYNEVIHQKKKQPIMKYIKKHQIQCPYCRAIQDKVLPFLSLKNIKRVKYVNSPCSLEQKTHTCIFKTKGIICGKSCHENGYCNRHFHIHNKQLLFDEYIKGTKPITNYDEIPVPILKKILKEKKVKHYSKLKKKELIKVLKELI